MPTSWCESYRQGNRMTNDRERERRVSLKQQRQGCPCCYRGLQRDDVDFFSVFVLLQRGGASTGHFFFLHFFCLFFFCVCVFSLPSLLLTAAVVASHDTALFFIFFILYPWGKPRALTSIFKVFFYVAEGCYPAVFPSFFFFFSLSTC